LLGAVEAAVVKQASGRMAAECLPPAAAQQRIYEAALRAVRRFREGQAPDVLRLPQPITVTIEWVNSEMADRAMLFPGVRRLEGKWTEFVADDVPSAYRAFRAEVTVARG
jgi:D-aminopeptidase